MSLYIPHVGFVASNSRAAKDYHAGKSTGPKTPAGKAIAARNATSHGLFARDIVLPHLGEDPAAYDALFQAFCQELLPQTLLEQHYVEEIAAASWRLRRLHRWQAQVYEDEKLTEDERLDKLDRVLRHETALHRQINHSVKLLAEAIPQISEEHARKLAQADSSAQAPSLVADFDVNSLDNTYQPPPPEPAEAEDIKNCENETLSPDQPAADGDGFYVNPDGRPAYIEPTTWQAILSYRAQEDDIRAASTLRYYRMAHIAALYDATYSKTEEENEENANNIRPFA